MAEIDGALVLASARALILAGQWELAGKFLDGATASDSRERAGLAVALAQVAVEIRQWRGTGDPAPALEAAAELVAAAGDEESAFDLDLLQLFSDYWAELVPGDGTPPHFGPDGRDTALLARLCDRAETLAAAAPDQRRAARAAFYAGLIADNLRGDPARAEELFTHALTACQPGDEDVAAEALRHLGGIAQAAGDLHTARRRWELSAERAQRAGWLPLALAQQALLAELAAEEGDPAAAAALAGEVRRWATALGLPRLAAQAEAVSPGR